MSRYLVILTLSYAVTGLLILGESMGGTCPAGQHWVNPHHRRAFTKGDGTLVKATEVAGHCRKNSRDFHVWNLKLKDGRPKFWMFGDEKSAQWTVEERERVLDALEETPSFLKNLDIDALYRMKDSRYSENPASNHAGNIVLYDEAFDSKRVLTHILNHEMAHRLFERLSASEQKSFLDAAKWEEKRTNGVSSFAPGRPLAQFMRANARLSVYEDFADDVSAYIHQPTRLKSVSPEIFVWMENHLKSKLDRGGGK